MPYLIVIAVLLLVSPKADVSTTASFKDMSTGAHNNSRTKKMLILLQPNSTESMEFLSYKNQAVL